MTHLDRVGESYCVLCRQALPRNQYDPFTPPDYAPPKKKWDGYVVLFFDISYKHASPERYRGIFRLHLESTREYPGIDEYVSQNNLVSCRWHRGCADCPRSRSRSVHYVHDHCYKLASQLFSGISLDQLNLVARFAKTTLPGVMMPLSPAVSPSGLSVGVDLLPPSSQDPDERTGLDSIIRAISKRLPTEVQYMIWEYADPFLKSISTCIWNLHSAYRPYLEAEHSRFEPRTSCPLSETVKIDRLGVNMVHVLGEDNVSEVGTGPQKWQYEIAVADANVDGIQASFGSHGLVALRLLYQDGSTSPWVGGLARKWFRTFRNIDINALSVVSDGFKIIDLDYQPDAENRHSHSPSLWNTDMLAHPARIFPVMDGTLGRPKSHGWDMRRNTKFIPLDVMRDGITSLTVWVGIQNTSFIQVNGDVRTRVGVGEPNYLGLPMTYYFAPGETVESVHLLAQRTPDNKVARGPFIVLVTSTGRTVYFGRYFLTAHGLGTLTSLGNLKTHKVVGLVVEMLPAMNCIGAALEPRDGPTSALHHRASFPQIEMFEDGEQPALRNTDVFRTIMVTRANLANVVCLRTQTAHGRCTGLYVEHGSGVIEVLGWWDPAQPTHTVYEDRSRRRLEAVSFIFSDMDNPLERTVELIVVGRALGVKRQMFIWDDPEREMAWMPHRCGDVLKWWDGSTDHVKIPAGTKDDDLVVHLE